MAPGRIEDDGPPGAQELHYVRRGSGPPLVLVHGLGSSWHTWASILDDLCAEREVIALDLPGFGESPPLSVEPSIAALADAVTAFLSAHDLEHAGLVGSSMGARLVLELARRGAPGPTVALDPGGFWRQGALRYFQVSIRASIGLIRLLQPAMPLLTSTRVGRTLLFSQFSPRPWRLPASLMLDEMRSFAVATALDETFDQLVHGPIQAGADSTRSGVTIGWGRHDRVCPPGQARVAMSRFPQARLHWFERSGHFPHWDQPRQTARLILASTGTSH